MKWFLRACRFFASGPMLTMSCWPAGHVHLTMHGKFGIRGMMTLEDTPQNNAIVELAARDFAHIMGGVPVLDTRAGDRWEHARAKEAACLDSFGWSDSTARKMRDAHRGMIQ